MKRHKPKKITRGGAPVRISRRVETKHGKEYVSWQIFWRENGKDRCHSRASEMEAGILADEVAIRLAKGEIRQVVLSGRKLDDYEAAIQVGALEVGAKRPMDHKGRLLPALLVAEPCYTLQTSPIVWPTTACDYILVSVEPDEEATIPQVLEEIRKCPPAKEIVLLSADPSRLREMLAPNYEKKVFNRVEVDASHWNEFHAAWMARGLVGKDGIESAAVEVEEKVEEGDETTAVVPSVESAEDHVVETPSKDHVEPAFVEVTLAVSRLVPAQPVEVEVQEPAKFKPESPTIEVELSAVKTGKAKTEKVKKKPKAPPPMEMF